MIKKGGKFLDINRSSLNRWRFRLRRLLSHGSQILKKEIKLLPEFKVKSNVTAGGLKGQIKYLFFVCEPHWRFFKKNSLIVWRWSKDTLAIIWRSKRGKLIIIENFSIIVLIALIIFPKTSPKQLTQISLADNDQNLGIRRYLPRAKDFIPLKSFETQELPSQLPLYAWMAPWNLEDQKSNLKRFAGLSAFWLTVAENGYDLNERSNIESFLDLIASQSKPEDFPLFLSVSGNPNFIYQALIDQEIQKKLIDNLLTKTKKWQFGGVDLDFEMLGEENRDLFTLFVRNLTDKFHENGKKVSVTLEARIENPPMDWSALGEIADEIRIMLYDYHAKGTNEPGPISPIGWIKEKMEYASVTIPKEKLIVGLPNYGYDWTKNEAPNAKYAYDGVAVSFESAVRLANDFNGQIYRALGNDERGFDIGSAPHFSYTDETGKEHSVFFEDKISLANKIKLISLYQPKGVIFWNVGLGDTFRWQATIDKEIEATKAKLESLMLEQNFESSIE